MILKGWNNDRYEPWHINSVRHAMENLQEWSHEDFDWMLVSMWEMMYGKTADRH